MGALSPTHWLIVIGIVVLLFGAKRLPDAARSLGRSARILKAEVREAREEGAGSDVRTPSPALDQAGATAEPAVEKQAVTQPSS